MFVDMVQKLQIFMYHTYCHSETQPYTQIFPFHVTIPNPGSVMRSAIFYTQPAKFTTTMYLRYLTVNMPQTFQNLVDFV